jgi:homoserine kinase type II
MLEQPPAAGDLLVPLLDLCDEAGLPIAPIIRNRSGFAREELQGRATLLAPRLVGRHVQHPTARHCETVGRFLARFHVTTHVLAEAAPAHPRDPAWLVAKLNVVVRSLPYVHATLLKDSIASVTSLLSREDVKLLPRGIVHGDLFRDNALFTERGLTGVLDFHHASAGHLLYDLAVAANDWCSDSSGLLDRGRTVAMLRAYDAHRPLCEAELWFFPLFALYAAVAFWLSRLIAAVAASSTHAARTKDPDEFRRIVQQHRAHLLYLDRREFDA